MSHHWRSESLVAAYSPRAIRRIAVNEPRVISLRKIEIDGEMKSIAVRLVESSDVIEEACELINGRYVKKGYGAAHRIPLSAHHATFTAELDGKVVGTITLAVEADRGLSADNTFGAEIDKLRSSGHKSLCELTKFAFADGFHSRQVMASLFHIVFVYGYRNFGCSDLLIEVHQKHARFYEMMLGFERLGAARVNASVNATLQLMRISVAEIRQRITDASEKRARSEARSLYGLFFPVGDEEGIYTRLMQSTVANDRLFDDALKIKPRSVSALREATPAVSIAADHIRALLLENAQLRRLLANSFEGDLEKIKPPDEANAV